MVTGAQAYLPVDLSGLRVAITAGANGIGKVMADGFAACGAQVFVSDIDAAALAACGYRHMRADAGSVADMEAFVTEAVAQLGGLDVLVNNAGIAGPTKKVEDVTPEELDATLQIDLAAMFHTARKAVPALRANGGGAIINLSSAAGRFGFPLRSPLCGGEMGGDRLHQNAGDRAGSGRHPGQRDLARPGGWPADSQRDPQQGDRRRHRRERADGESGDHHQPALLRHPIRYRQHGALSRQPLRHHDQRSGSGHRWRHAGPDLSS